LFRFRSFVFWRTLENNHSSVLERLIKNYTVCLELLLERSKARCRWTLMTAGVMTREVQASRLQVQKVRHNGPFFKMDNHRDLVFPSSMDCHQESYRIGTTIVALLCFFIRSAKSSSKSLPYLLRIRYPILQHTTTMLSRIVLVLQKACSTC